MNTKSPSSAISLQSYLLSRNDGNWSSRIRALNRRMGTRLGDEDMKINERGWEGNIVTINLQGPLI